MAQIFAGGLVTGSTSLAASHAVPTRDGAYLVVGTQFRGDLSKDRALAIEFYNDGSYRQNTYPSTSTPVTFDRMFAAAAQLVDGSFIATGIAWASEDSEDTDIWIVQLDAALDKTWEHTLGGNARGYQGCGVSATRDGGFAVVGILVADDGSSGTRVIKFTQDKKIEWDKTYTDCVMSSIVQSKDGGYICSGYPSSKAPTIAAMRLAADGSRAWMQTYDCSIDLPARSAVTQAHDDTFVIASGNWICKIDENGKRLWSRSSDLLTLTSIAQCADGTLAIAGTQLTDAVGGFTYGYFALLSADGTAVVWDNVNPAPDSDVRAVIPIDATTVATFGSAQNFCDQTSYVVMAGYKHVTKMS